jgi:Flp pilus assembly protein TadD
MKLRTLAMIPVCVAIAACATTTEKPRAKAQVAVQEQVGFTITEAVSMSEAVRTDYDRALALLGVGNLEQGIAVLETVVANAPGVSGPQIDLGIALHQEGDLEAAEERLLQALELNPEHPVIHNELGIIYRKTGRFDAARRSYEAALATYPGYHHARRNLGVLCDLYLADPECALESYEAYMQTVPGDEEAAMWIVDLRNRAQLQE